MKKLAIALFALVFGLAANAQPQQRGGTPEEKAQRLTDRMKTELNLTDEQVKQVYEINLEMAKGMDEIDKGNKEARQEVQSAYKKKLATVLNDEQLAKAKEMRKKRQVKMREHRQDMAPRNE